MELTMDSVNWPLVGATILPNVGGWVGSIYVKKNYLDWYESLKRPNWRPPNYAFPPVWTTLYSSMGYASYLVWKDGGGFDGSARLPLTFFAGQLALNWAWTPIFFGAKNIKGGLIDIILLDSAVLGTAFLFFKVNKTAGCLLLPYIAWLGLASALNYVIYRDNCAVTDKKEEQAPKK
ncbi:translocator protein isoform X1 [Nilaparvata lugens]|uniref:translocator protein isoform X1 n=2 Tax=Nilaparvata lugens TaxID=108931 RepID=UPI00193D2ECF|nr:translocator protein isoform X1 [Nilaparvata lugens]